jgi:hypothetical protein
MNHEIRRLRHLHMTAPLAGALVTAENGHFGRVLRLVKPEPIGL